MGNHCPSLLWNLNHFEYQAVHLFGMDVGASWSLNLHASVSNLHSNRLLITESNIKHREEETTMMASKDDNKRKYSADGVEEEAEEAPPKKQKVTETPPPQPMMTIH
jgi:hypothetical protein